VVCVERDRVADVVERCEAVAIVVTPLGGAGGNRLVLEPLIDVSVDELTTTWQSRLPSLFDV
jgi:hypothetical protein